MMRFTTMLKPRVIRELKKDRNIALYALLCTIIATLSLALIIEHFWPLVTVFVLGWIAAVNWTEAACYMRLLKTVDTAEQLARNDAEDANDMENTQKLQTARS